MAEVLQARRREVGGTRAAKRLRRDGALPAVLYGHGEENVPLSLSVDDFSAVLRHGSRVVDLDGDVKQTALIREVQWGPMGIEPLHVDFTRVSAHESVQVQVALELRGEAPGTKVGGVLEQPVHELEVECRVDAIPDKLRASVNSLELGESLTVADIELPSGVKILAADDLVIVQCVEPVAEEELAEAEAGPVEPELIERKPGEEAEAE